MGYDRDAGRPGRAVGDWRQLAAGVADLETAEQFEPTKPSYKSEPFLC